MAEAKLNVTKTYKKRKPRKSKNLEELGVEDYKQLERDHTLTVLDARIFGAKGALEELVRLRSEFE